MCVTGARASASIFPPTARSLGGLPVPTPCSCSLARSLSLSGIPGTGPRITREARNFLPVNPGSSGRRRSRAGTGAHPGVISTGPGGQEPGTRGNGRATGPAHGPGPCQQPLRAHGHLRWAWPAVLGLLAPPTSLGASTASRGRRGVGACSFGPQILAG